MNIIAADLFCGAGGTSNGLVRAVQELGYGLKLLAINHWKLAIATHSANYPFAEHLCESLDNVNPRDVVPGGYLDLMVASPECTHHSRARGGRPICDQSRASAWHVLRWAEALHIENILIENVPEFQTWGPLDRAGDVVQRMKGKTYLAFLEALRSLGYTVEARVLNAADYGDPTSRKRLFILAKKNGPVVFPEPSHGNNSEKNIFSEVRKPWLTARGVIDWNVKGKSIFGRKKPLSLNTIRRITKGLEKYSGLPYLVTLYGKSNATGIDQPMPTITAKGEHIGICEPFLVEYHGSNRTGGERVRSVNEPLPTVDTSNRLGLCEPFIVAVNHGKDDNRSYSMDMPMPTITSVDAWGLVQPFLVKYYGKGGVASVDEPLDTITAKDRFGLVIPVADGYVEVDILYRMLLPHELAAAMSFPSDYKFFGNRGDQVKQIGNAVPGETAKALVMALIGAGRNE